MLRSVRPTIAALAVCSAALLACGSGTTPSAAAPAAASSASGLAISPPQTALPPGGSVKFEALQVAPSTVSWAVAEAHGGSIDASGRYTAPEVAGTYHVIATRTDDPRKQDAAVVTVSSTTTPPDGPVAPPRATVAIVPTTVTVQAGKTFQFSAAASDGSAPSVTWSVQEGAAGGTITAAGLYTAPYAGGTFHVTAARAGDAGAVVATVTVPGTPLPAPGDPAWVKVTDFGAAGDGTTDDTAAFRAAAATGKNLLVPGTAAHYRITGKVVVQGSVMGDGSLPTVRMYGADGSRDAQHTIFELDGYAGAGAVFAGLHLDGGWDQVSKNGEWNHGIAIQGSTNVTVENNFIEHAYGDDILVGGEASPNPSRNVVIQYNRLEDPYRCTIAVISAQNVTIRGNAHKRSSDYVASIDLEPNPNGVDTDWDVTISEDSFDVEGIAIQAYTFGGQSPRSGRVTIERSTAVANRFFIKPPGTSDWAGFTLQNNAYLGRRATSTGVVSFAEIVDTTGSVTLVGNDVRPNAYGQDLIQNVWGGLQATGNTWHPPAAGYSVQITSAPGGNVSGNQLDGVTASIAP